jgi:ABC-type phosphonate transport system ATPase subunit
MNGTQFSNYDDVTMNDVCGVGEVDSSTPFHGGTCVGKLEIHAISKLTEVGLNEFDSDRLSAQYSGGMKRKLSVACATIGNPEVSHLTSPLILTMARIKLTHSFYADCILGRTKYW